jgi:ankyrin repeat protein
MQELDARRREQRNGWAMDRKYAINRRALVSGLLASVAISALSRRALAEINVDIYNRTPFADAAGKGDLAKVRGMLSSGESPNGVDLDGRPAIMLASLGNHVEVVSALIAAKVRCDAKDKLGTTALLVASERGFDEVVSLLIKAKANLNLDGRDGLTPLMVAAQRGHLRVVELLTRAGADLTAQDRTGRTALEWADTNNRRAVADFLRRSGAKS